MSAGGCGCDGPTTGCGCGGCAQVDAPSEAADLRALLNEASRSQPADEIIAVKRHTWCGSGPPDPRDAGVLLSAGNIASSGSRPTGPAYLTAFGAYAVTGEQAALELFTAADQYRQRRRCGADPVLAARGEGVLRPAGAGVLWPCRRSVFDQGPVAASAPMPRAAWEQLPRTLRAFAVGRGFVPESTPAPAPVSAPGSGANGPAPPPTHEGALHVVVPRPGGVDFDGLMGGGRGDPCDCVGAAECTLEMRTVLDYGGWKLCVTNQWFWDLMRDEDWVLDPGDTLQLLWGEFDGGGVIIDEATMATLTGCWMIDVDRDTHVRSYSMFFDDGNGPHKFLWHALELVQQFSDEIKDETSGVTTCAGLRDFIDATLRGREPTSLNPELYECGVKFRAVSEETWLDPVRSMRDCGAGPEFTDCDAFPNMGGAFDAWSERLYLATGDGIYRVGVWATDPTQPGANNLGWALSDVGAVHVPANRLAFKGYVHDFSLFWARVALQHAFDRDDTSFLLGAHVYARGALTELVDYGRILIHEMGHLFIGFGGHCECVKSELPCACCFDIAAERWKCRVASRLGLPNGFWQCGADPLTVSHANPCGGEGAAYGLICWRHELCVPGDVANFATGTCT